MGIQTNFSLEKVLNSEASSQNYIKNLDSYTFNRGISIRGPKRKRFFITTVDINGKSKPYTIQGQTFVALALLINPASVSINMSKIINRTQTMVGWIEEHWGEELDTITFQGSGAAFIWGGPTPPSYTAARSTKTTQADTPEQIREMFNDYMNIPYLGPSEPVGIGDRSGLTVKRRRETLSYDEFRRIIHLMNANAAKFDLHGLVKERLYIQISFDQATYRGYFESIDITENAETPFKFIYTITFKSEKTIYSFLNKDPNFIRYIGETDVILPPSVETYV